MVRSRSRGVFTVLKTPRLTLKILQFEQIPESSSGLPLHLSHIFRCTFLVIQNLNAEALLRLSQWSFRSCAGVSAALVSLSIHLQMIHLQSQGKIPICLMFVFSSSCSYSESSLSSVAGASTMTTTHIPLSHFCSRFTFRTNGTSFLVTPT